VHAVSAQHPRTPGPGLRGLQWSQQRGAARCGRAYRASVDLSAALGLAQSQQLPPRLHHQPRLAQFRGALLRPRRADVVGFGDHGGGGSSRLAAGRTAQPRAPRFIGQHGNARGLQPRQPAQHPAALRVHLHVLAKRRMPIRPCTRRHGVVGRDLVAALRRADVQ